MHNAPERGAAQRGGNLAKSEEMPLRKERLREAQDELEGLKALMSRERKRISEVINRGQNALQQGSNYQSHQKFYSETGCESNSEQFSEQLQFRSTVSKFREGLIGSIEEYNKLEKQDLIDKLIVVEHLMKKLYKRNKELEG